MNPVSILALALQVSAAFVRHIRKVTDSILSDSGCLSTVGSPLPPSPSFRLSDHTDFAFLGDPSLTATGLEVQGRTRPLSDPVFEWLFMRGSSRSPPLPCDLPVIQKDRGSSICVPAAGFAAFLDPIFRPHSNAQSSLIFILILTMQKVMVTQRT